MALEIQIWQKDQKINMDESTHLHISFADDDKDMLEAITLTPEQFLVAMTAYNEIRKTFFHQPIGVVHKKDIDTMRLKDQHIIDARLPKSD